MITTTIEAALPVLARRANEAHENCLKGLRHGLQHAITAGEALLEAKGQLAHGEWIPWVEENCEFCQDTACQYIRTANAATLMGVDFGNIRNLPQEEVLRLLLGKGPAAEKGDKNSSLPWPECIDKLQEMVWRLRERWPTEAIDRLPGELRKLATIMEHGLQCKSCLGASQ